MYRLFWATRGETKTDVSNAQHPTYYQARTVGHSAQSTLVFGTSQSSAATKNGRTFSFYLDFSDVFSRYVVGLDWWRSRRDPAPFSRIDLIRLTCSEARALRGGS